jgi:predicted transcriptional regulator
MIVGGNKQVELRRRPPGSAAIGAKALLYATSPMSAIIACATIETISVGSPADIWNAFKSVCGCTAEEYDRYFHNSEQAAAIHLTAAKSLEVPIPLSELVERHKLRPPVAWCWIDKRPELIARIPP